ncbi:hypothetical protein GLOTRDRAFT_132905 [Gloeophyllum trabeum ATCC 11539]|uniref:Transcription factor domain-containing protein n=1 Tax=Gloeophyllum trabeum (strain ATCC 11539 / FP-39264 / Madison 617) TaxID=670483 RepID=S7PVL4_GLOTA|nr:uncharacterized protein GLOTRDRAFT_132905 [Gloeophyllum trabeum ATCC 11539]EPQ51538.1 hypothetical protein GLOTRDRAFT_132905 [Gloeophyllum trabeum ATCC 11539]
MFTLQKEEEAQKCDAQRPFCKTCQIAGKEDECHYTDGSRGSLARDLLRRNRELENRLKEYEEKSSSGSPQPPDSSSASSSDAPSSSSTSPSLHCLGDFDGPAQSISIAHADCAIIEPVLDIAYPDFSGTGAEVVFPYAPANSDVSFHLADTCRHSNREFRDLFISHGLQLGLGICETKAGALSLGECSSASSAVSPLLIHVAQLWGCLLWQEVNLKFGVREEDEELAQVLALLNMGPSSPHDAMTFVMAHCLLSTYHFSKVNMVDGREHLIKAATVASDFQLGFDQVASRAISDHPSNGLYSAQEETAILCQLIYHDIGCSLLMNVPSAGDGRMYNQFKNLQWRPSDFSNLDLIICRAHSVSHLQESGHLAGVWLENTNGASSFPACCYEWYFDLLQRTCDHIATLTPALLKFSVLSWDRHRLLVLKLCLAMEHAAAAELYELLADTEPSCGDKAVSAALEIVRITATFEDCDFHFLDPILGICWTAAARVLRKKQAVLRNSFRSASTGLLQLDESTIRRSLSTMVTASLKLERSMPFVTRPPSTEES